LRYGLLTYGESRNLGDEIQSLAARRFLPRVDFTVDREALPSLPSEAPASVILNGWFMHHPENWPPPPHLRPLLISMHISVHASIENRSRASPSWHLLAGANGDYFRRWGPVGARDWHTLQLLDRHRIPAYWSACLTLTLERPAVPREDIIYGVDLGPEMLAHLRARTGTPVVGLTHMLAPTATTDPGKKLAIAAGLLRRYAAAKAVVTTRLHCALPCLAMETPVLFVEAAVDRYRFDGLRDLLHHTDPDGFLADRHDFAFDPPPANPPYYARRRSRLIQEAERFVAAANGEAGRKGAGP
jgi:hypothetical protein